MPDQDIVNYWKMDEVSVHMLNELFARFDFDTVISSSWQAFCRLEQIEDIFAVNRLALQIHDDWCTGKIKDRYDCTRSREITAWLERHPDVNQYLILDDHSSGGSLSTNPLGLIKEHMIFVNSDTGIGSSNIYAMHMLLTKWSRDGNKNNPA